MLLLFGTGEMDRPVRCAGSLQCSNCGSTTPATMTKHCCYFHLFYIPLIPYSTTYYIYCPNCQAIYIVPAGKAKLLRRYPDAVAYPQELQTIRRGQKICPKCGAPVEFGLPYCARCGERQY